MLNSNPLLPSPGLPKRSPIFFHLIFKPCAGETGPEKTVSALKKEKDHSSPALSQRLSKRLHQKPKGWDFPGGPVAESMVRVYGAQV